MYVIRSLASTTSRCSKEVPYAVVLVAVSTHARRTNRHFVYYVFYGGGLFVYFVSRNDKKGFFSEDAVYLQT